MIDSFKRQIDIQILRGLAVTLVVLFHWELPFLKSGFLGVDIFFVISGFLMAILYRNAGASSFLLRRAKRLLPAYFVTISATLVAAYCIVLPVDFKQVTEQTFYASILSSNFGFWFQNSYFDKTAFKPLLHLWSLGVEIQFYFLVPILFYLHKKSKWTLPIIALTSITLCFIIIHFSPKTSFFLTPFRMWQFLIGIGVAQLKFRSALASNKQFQVKPHWGMSFFVILLLIPALPVDGQSLQAWNGHPSLAALLISLATAGVLYFQLPDIFMTSMVGRSFEKLGDWS